MAVSVSVEELRRRLRTSASSSSGKELVVAISQSVLCTSGVVGIVFLDVHGGEAICLWDANAVQREESDAATLFANKRGFEQACRSLSACGAAPLGPEADSARLFSARVSHGSCAPVVLRSSVVDGLEIRIVRRGDVTVLVVCGEVASVLRRCRHVACGNDLILELQSLPAAVRGQLERRARSAATIGRSVRALAELELPTSQFEDPDVSRDLEDEELTAMVQGGLAFVGLAEFGAVLRDNAAQSVVSLQRVGCRIVLISSASVAAAASIARASGVLGRSQQPGEVATAGELLNAGSGSSSWRRILAVAMAAPTTRQALVSALHLGIYIGRELGDVDALRSAPVGITFACDDELARSAAAVDLGAVVSLRELTKVVMDLLVTDDKKATAGGAAGKRGGGAQKEQGGGCVVA